MNPSLVEGWKNVIVKKHLVPSILLLEWSNEIRRALEDRGDVRLFITNSVWCPSASEVGCIVLYGENSDSIWASIDYVYTNDDEIKTEALLNGVRPISTIDELKEKLAEDWDVDNQTLNRIECFEAGRGLQK